MPIDVVSGGVGDPGAEAFSIEHAGVGERIQERETFKKEHERDRKAA